MKTLSLIFVLFVCCLQAQSQTVYCWAAGKKQYFIADQSQSIIRFKDKKANTADFISSLASKANIEANATYVGGLPAVIVQHESPKAAANFLAQAKQVQATIDYVLPVYKDSDLQVHYATNEISIGLKDDISIETVIAKYGKGRLFRIYPIFPPVFMLFGGGFSVVF
jgi:hypothetical protein